MQLFKNIVNPWSRRISVSLYNEPTNVDILGFNNPTPIIMNNKPKKKTFVCLIARSRWPRQRSQPPYKTAFLWVIYLSASQPPGTHNK